MNLNIKQKQAFEKLSKLKAGALFMKMGTGKTKVAIDLIISRQNDFDLVVWIAPASLINEDNYKIEILKWSKKLKKEIKYLSIVGISASDFKYLELVNLAKNNQIFCIVDESITIKNTEAGRTKRLLNLWDKFKFRLILNGTPITKGLIDLYSQIQFIHPNILNMTESQFANNFLIYYQDGYKSWKRWSKPENEEALIEIIRPYIFDSDLDIDVKLNNFDFNIELTASEKGNYIDIKNEYLKNKNEISFLEMAQYFQSNYTCSNNKIDILLELLGKIKAKNEKVIIYVKFLKEIEFLKENGLDFIEFSGRIKDRKILISDFKNNHNILVCTYGVGSLGLNLQFCNNIVYFSQTFDYKNKEQSLYRIYRTGQINDCNIFNFWVNTGLENIIKMSLDKKQNVLTHLKKIIDKKDFLKL